MGLIGIATWVCKNPRRVMQLATEAVKAMKTLIVEASKPDATVTNILYAVLKGASVEILKEIVQENPGFKTIIASVLNPSGKDVLYLD